MHSIIFYLMHRCTEIFNRNSKMGTFTHIAKFLQCAYSIIYYHRRQSAVVPEKESSNVNFALSL